MNGSALGGKLNPIPNCYINIPSLNNETIPMYIVPDLSDSKGAVFSEENGIGRSSPFTSFQHSEARQIGWTAHFILTNKNDQDAILKYIRLLEACVYPLTKDTPGPYSPPPIVKLKCGLLLSGNNYQDEIPAILKSYTLKFDTSVPWDTKTLMPYKIDIDLNFVVVYNQSKLPGAEMILQSGY